MSEDLPDLAPVTYIDKMEGTAGTVTVNSKLGVNQAIRPYTSAPTFLAGEMGYTQEAYALSLPWPSPKVLTTLATLYLTTGVWICTGRVTIHPGLPQDVYSIKYGIDPYYQNEGYSAPLVGNMSYQITRMITVTGALQATRLKIEIDWDDTVDSSSDENACMIDASSTSLQCIRIV